MPREAGGGERVAPLGLSVADADAARDGGCTRVPPRPNDWPCTGDCADGLGVLTRSDRGFGLALQASAYGNEACESRVRETTLLVVNARHEYLDNVYHSFEEVFALLETAEALGEDLSAMRLVFANTNKRKRVSRGPLTLFQLHGGAPVGAPPAGARRQMVELFAALLGREPWARAHHARRRRRRVL